MLVPYFRSLDKRLCLFCSNRQTDTTNYHNLHCACMQRINNVGTCYLHVYSGSVYETDRYRYDGKNMLAVCTCRYQFLTFSTFQALYWKLYRGDLSWMYNNKIINTLKKKYYNYSEKFYQPSGHDLSGAH